MQCQKFILVNLLSLAVLVPALLATLTEEFFDASMTETNQNFNYDALIALRGFNVLERKSLDLVPRTLSTLNFGVSLSPQLHNRDLDAFSIGVLIAIADTYKGEISLIPSDKSHQSITLQAIDSISFGDYYANTKMVPAISSHDVSHIFNMDPDQSDYHFYQMMLPSSLYCQNARELRPQSSGAMAGNGLYYGDQISIRCIFQYQVHCNSDHIVKLHVSARLWDGPLPH